MSASRSEALSRRQLLQRGGAVAGVVGLGGAAFGVAKLLGEADANRPLPSYPTTTTGSVRTFRSRPDLRPPAVAMTETRSAPGYVFLGPGTTGDFTKGPPAAGPQMGPLIVDEHGEVVWLRPLSGTRWATNVMVSRYRGEPVLTWWEGDVISPGFGRGEGVILDRSYTEISRVRAGNGRQTDFHEFQLTPEGTALLTCFPRSVPMDLSPVGGPRNGTVLESIIQEADIRTGEVLLEWRSLEHIPVSESHEPAYDPFLTPYDYLHVNSIDVLPDGHLLVSGRATFTLYKLHRRTGEVIWRLGGKHSDFTLSNGARFAWQHDARHVADGLITVFDNGEGPVHGEPQSRAVLLKVDTERRTVELAHAYHRSRGLLAGSMGSVQILPDGHVFVGWGAQPYISEFAPDGTILADAQLPQLLSYRAYRFAWNATPREPPALGTHRHPATGRPILSASWNGATDVTHWRVYTGTAPDSLGPVGVAKRHGFETEIPLGVGDAYAAVAALDPSRRELAKSPTIRI